MILSAKNLGKKFGDFEALKDFNLSVHPGECVGLLGPNGAGKSTFIGTVYGVVKRSAGELKVFGIDPDQNSREIKKKLGVVTQDNALDESLSVTENMELYAAFMGVEKSQRKERIKELLEYMQLQAKAHAPIRALSGGMKRRLTFVRALLSDPELIILDEPTTGLDPAVRHLLWEKVLDLKKRGKPVLLTTHYMHEAEILCNRIVVLNNGSVVDSESPQSLIQQHTPGFVGLFEDSASNRKVLEGLKNSSWTSYSQGQHFYVRAPTLESLVELQNKSSLLALQLRPANLEDVFIKLTGEGLSAND